MGALSVVAIAGHMAAVAAPAPFSPRTATIPDLAWIERSDWVNVRTPAAQSTTNAATAPAPLLAAKGDGVQDDTAAIQAALDKMATGSTLYFPKGTYRITRTLLPPVGKRLLGVTLIGHGRSTVLVWDGQPGEAMFWQNEGWPLGRFMGLTFDGRGKAAVGMDIGCMRTFETEMRFQHMAFLNCTDSGIRLGAKMRLASAETLYENCLFENCGRGVAIINFNYLDHTFVDCEFRRCNTGIYAWKGSNFYARECRFEQNREADVIFRGEAGSSLRRCTSEGSKLFVSYGASVAPLVIQDCRIDSWQNKDGAVILGGAPVLLFDTVFSTPPSEDAPVVCTQASQRLILSNNRAEGSLTVVHTNGMGRIYDIPTNSLGGTLTSSRQFFLKSEVQVPDKIFDAQRDFGAKGDGKADDTEAVQKTIDAARTHGKGALAYLPKGIYAVTATLKMTGGGYTVGGCGFGSAVVWRGPAGGTTLEVREPDRLTLENLNVGRHDHAQGLNEIDILHIGTDSGKPTAMQYDRVAVFGMYQKQPHTRGFRALNLGKNDKVFFREFNGNVRFTDSADATIYLGTTYEGTVMVDGKSPRRSGFLGGSVRLGTVTNPGLWIKDNHSLVMSDLYVESSDQYGRLEGSESLPAGRVVIQGAKFEILPTSASNAVDIVNYRGALVAGTYQYYVGNPLHKFVQQGKAPFALTLWGSCFYTCKPDVKLAPGSTLTALGNATVGSGGEGEHADAGAAPGVADTPAADVLPTIGLALDDLRRLGAVDMELAHSLF